MNIIFPLSGVDWLMGGLVYMYEVRHVCKNVCTSLYMYIGVHACRGDQYLHWVMHKWIMVKVGGKRNTRKVCKKQVNLCKTAGKICQSRGGNNNFSETGGNVLKQAK